MPLSRLPVKSIFLEDEAIVGVVETCHGHCHCQPPRQVQCQVCQASQDNDPLYSLPVPGVSCSSPGSSRAPLLCQGSPPQDIRRLTRSYSCHQFDARGALLQFGAGLGACFPMEVGINMNIARPLPKFTDEEVFLASHPGADYTTAKRK